jgi:hypothetical protein
MSLPALRFLWVLYSSGLSPQDVVEFHLEVAAVEQLLAPSLQGKARLEWDFVQVDRPLARDDFLEDEEGGLRLNPTSTREDLERRDLVLRDYSLRLVSIAWNDDAPYELSVEKTEDSWQVTLSRATGLSLSQAAADALAIILGSSGEGNSPAPTGSSPADSLRDIADSAWSGLAVADAPDGSGSDPPPVKNRLRPLYRRVAVASGNRSLFLVFRGETDAPTRVDLAGRAARLEPLDGGTGGLLGAWVDIPGRPGISLASAGGEPLTRVLTAPVAFVSARWRNNPPGLSAFSVLEVDVRPEALGGGLRLVRARVAGLGGSARVAFREFPGGSYVAQIEGAPIGITVEAHLAGWRIRPARLDPESEAESAIHKGNRSPVGSRWISGQVSPLKF